MGLRSWLLGRPRWEGVAGVLELEARAERAESSLVAQSRRADELAVTIAKRSFDGAARGDRWNDWRTTGSDADSTARGQRGILAQRVRDLVRNNPHAQKAVTTLVTHIVGKGIRPRPASQSEPFNELLTRIWREWVAVADHSGEHTYYALQAMAVRGCIESGESFIRRIHLRSKQQRVPLGIQVLEADFLDSRKDGPIASGGEYVQGKEYDASGRLVAFWFFTSHPGSRGGAFTESVRVPADDVIHLFVPTRPGQKRGVTWLTSVIATLRDTGDFTSAELMKQKIAALLALVVQGGETAGDTLTPLKDAQGRVVEDLYPGLIAYLASDRTITTVNPPKQEGYEGFVRAQLMQVSSGMNITYHQLSGDLANANFSATRAGYNEFFATVEQTQELWIIPQIGQRVWDWMMDAAYTAGVLTVPTCDVVWTPPARPIVDPTADASARRAALRDGTSTLGIETDRLGRDLRQVLRERAREKAILDDLGLVLDSSPWDMSGAGQLQLNAETTAENPTALDEQPVDATPRNARALAAL